MGGSILASSTLHAVGGLNRVRAGWRPSGQRPGSTGRHMAKDIKKIVLSYSGGLDTSIMLKWLQETYQCEIVTFTADLGQGEELEPARRKAEMLGIKEIHIEDVREEFVRDFVFPMFRANAALRRPVSARHLDRPAGDRQAPGRNRRGDRAPTPSRTARPARATTRSVSSSPPMRSIRASRSLRHGASGICAVAHRLLDYAEKNQIPIAKDKRGEAPFSVDANLLHTSSEGMVLEDPSRSGARLCCAAHGRSGEGAQQARDHHCRLREGRRGLGQWREAVAAALLTKLNELGGKHGVGRLDLVENRFVGMKIARPLRDPRRHHPARGTSRHRIDHARSRRGASQG